MLDRLNKNGGKIERLNTQPRTEGPTTGSSRALPQQCGEGKKERARGLKAEFSPFSHPIVFRRSVFVLTIGCVVLRKPPSHTFYFVSLLFLPLRPSGATLLSCSFSPPCSLEGASLHSNRQTSSKLYVFRRRNCLETSCGFSGGVAARLDPCAGYGQLKIAQPADSR